MRVGGSGGGRRLYVGLGQRPAQALARIEQLPGRLSATGAAARLLVPHVEHGVIAVRQQLVLLVAQPPSTMTAHRAAADSIQIRRMGASDAVIDPAPLGVVVDVERLLQMHGDLGAGPHVTAAKACP